MKFLGHEVDAESLLSEIEFFFEHSSQTHGLLSNGTAVKTDVGYVEDFFKNFLQEFKN